MYFLQKRPGYHSYELYSILGTDSTFNKLICPEYLGIIGIQNIQFTVVHTYEDGSMIVIGD